MLFASHFIVGKVYLCANTEKSLAKKEKLTGIMLIKIVCTDNTTDYAEEKVIYL